MKIERVITVFDSSSEELDYEHNVDHIQFEELKKIFSSEIESDPLLYNPKKITPEIGQRLNRLLETPLDFDFNLKTYFLECYQIT